MFRPVLPAGLRPLPVIALAFILWQCDSVDSDAADPTRAAVPTVSSSVDNSNDVAIAANQNATNGIALRGFSLQSIESPNLCLASTDTSFASGARYALATCTKDDTQLFFWGQGLLSQGNVTNRPLSCLTGAYTLGATLSVGSCPKAPGFTAAALIKSPAVWILSADTNVLYNKSVDGNFYTITPSGGLAVAGKTLTTVKLETSGPVAHLVPTTSLAGPTRIYLNDGTNRCLTEDSDAAVLSECEALQDSQLWDLRTHNIVSHAGLCLTAESASVNSAVRLTPCRSGTSTQLWYLAAGTLGLATPYPNLVDGALALDVNAAIDTNRPVINYLSTVTAGWSIGAKSAN